MNNNPLSGEIPYLENLKSCSFKNTNLCYNKTYYNQNCNYTENYCSECKSNASLIDNICQCDKNYSGLGYLYCNNEIETEIGIIIMK